MRLLTGFAVVATLLALVGLYGVLSLSVGSRTKEIAVRKAIGAQGRQIVGLVLGEGSRLIAVGLVLGVVAALAVGRLLEALLFDVKPADPLALAGAAIVFALRRAAGVPHAGAARRPRRSDGSAASGMTQRFFDGLSVSGAAAAYGNRTAVAFVPPLKNTPPESQYIERSTTIGTPLVTWIVGAERFVVQSPARRRRRRC